MQDGNLVEVIKGFAAFYSEGLFLHCKGRGGVGELCGCTRGLDFGRVPFKMS